MSDKKSEKILVIDDTEDIRKMLVLGLRRYGYDLREAPDGSTAKKLLQKGKFDVIIADLKLPDVEGLELISFIQEVAPLSQLVVITAHASLEIAKRCVELGASAFILKPCSLEQIRYTIETVVIERRLKEEEESNYDHLISEHRFVDMVGKSLEMRKIYHTIRTVAKTASPVIILGETGTGKELVARAIHKNSKRSGKPMVVVNCAGLSETLLESELFGHVKGAFTGAVKDKSGLLEVASSGTLFLDEITEISPRIQAKLLRFIQDGEYRPVGGTVNKKSNVRILVSTNRNIEKEMDEGRFREDLYHRLNVIRICLPPLRGRREDIPLLSHYFLKNFAAEQDKPIKTISPEALSLLMGRDFPGNVRELQNIIERSVTFCTGETILPCHLYQSMEVPGGESGGDETLNLSKSVEATEKAQVVKALQAAGGNKTKAAELLGIDRITLWRKLKAWGLKG